MAKDSTAPVRTRTKRTAAQRAQDTVKKAQQAFDREAKRVEKATLKVNAANEELNAATQAQAEAQRELDYANANPALPTETTPVPVDDAGTVTDSNG